MQAVQEMNPRLHGFCSWFSVEETGNCMNHHESSWNSAKHIKVITVDGRNPASVDRVNIPLFTRFCASQVVWDDFWTINSIIHQWNEWHMWRKWAIDIHLQESKYVHFLVLVGCETSCLGGMFPCRVPGRHRKKLGLLALYSSTPALIDSYKASVCQSRPVYYCLKNITSPEWNIYDWIGCGSIWFEVFFGWGVLASYKTI